MKFFLAFIFMLASLHSFATSNTISTTTKTTATLSSTCYVQTQNISFGTIVPGQSSSVANGTMTVLCTKNTSYNMTLLFPEYGHDCTYMAGISHGDRINYGTWLGSVGGTVLSNANYISEVGTGANQNYTFFSEINPNVSYAGCPTQTPNPGYNPYSTPDNYTDTVTFSIAY